MVHRMGYRYKLYDSSIPGKPDLVFPSRQKSFSFTAVFGTGTADVERLDCQNRDKATGSPRSQEISPET